MSPSISAVPSQFLKLLKSNAVPILLLLLLTGATYFEITTHSLLINWDDLPYITNNSAIREISVQNLKAVFSQSFAGNYAPVQFVSYMIDYAIWENNPFGYFFANIFYHYISGVLLYFLLLRAGCWKWGALFGTAIFLVHPVQVESVAWASQRKNLLAMIFFLSSFHGYISYRERVGNDRLYFYVWSLFAFCLSLLSKPITVIFPLMLMMYDHLILSLRGSIYTHKDKIPYFIAAAIIAVFTTYNADSSGRVEYPANAMIVLPLSMLPVLLRYFQLLMCPIPSLQSFMYFPSLRNEIDPIVILSLIVAVALLLLGHYLYKKNQPCMFWYSLFFLGLIPVSQIVPLVTMMNDRYMYFPMLGVAGIVAHLTGSIREKPGMEFWWKFILTILVSIVICLSALSYARGKVWRNSISLFSDAVAKYPDNAKALSHLAETYVMLDDLEMARIFYEKAANIGHLTLGARHNLAKIYLIAREYDKAYQEISWLLLAGDQNKTNPLLIGEYYYGVGLYTEAEQYLSSYLYENSNDSHALYLLGRVNYLTGNWGLAREFYDRALKEGSATPDLYYAVACLEFMEGYSDQSLNTLKKAFENGLKSRNMHEDEKCLTWIKNNPRFRQLILRAMGE